LSPLTERFHELLFLARTVDVLVSENIVGKQILVDTEKAAPLNTKQCLPHWQFPLLLWSILQSF
jgi:hypothetical protein